MKTLTKTKLIWVFLLVFGVSMLGFECSTKEDLGTTVRKLAKKAFGARKTARFRVRAPRSVRGSSRFGNSRTRRRSAGFRVGATSRFVIPTGTMNNRISELREVITDAQSPEVDVFRLFAELVAAEGEGSIKDTEGEDLLVVTMEDFTAEIKKPDVLGDFVDDPNDLPDDGAISGYLMDFDLLVDDEGKPDKENGKNILIPSSCYTKLAGKTLDNQVRISLDPEDRKKDTCKEKAAKQDTVVIAWSEDQSKSQVYHPYLGATYKFAKEENGKETMEVSYEKIPEIPSAAQTVILKDCKAPDPNVADKNCVLIKAKLDSTSAMGDGEINAKADNGGGFLQFDGTGTDRQEAFDSGGMPKGVRTKTDDAGADWIDDDGTTFADLLGNNDDDFDFNEYLDFDGSGGELGEDEGFDSFDSIFNDNDDDNVFSDKFFDDLFGDGEEGDGDGFDDDFFDENDPSI